jgi:hypothetical protein
MTDLSFTPDRGSYSCRSRIAMAKSFWGSRHRSLTRASNAYASSYQDLNRAYFFTESGDGALVIKPPSNPDLTHCAKFKESRHCLPKLILSLRSRATW